MRDKELVGVRLPRQTMEKIRRIVEKQNGLFEDESDYVAHCIIDHNRRFNGL